MIAGHQVRAIRLTFVGELGWELHVPNDAAVDIYQAVMQEGAKHGVTNGGYRALDSLSLEKGEIFLFFKINFETVWWNALNQNRVENSVSGHSESYVINWFIYRGGREGHKEHQQDEDKVSRAKLTQISRTATKRTTL